MAFDLNGALSGGIGGGLAGGSAFGPIGALAGAGIGGLLGGFNGSQEDKFNLPGFEERQKFLQQQIEQASNFGNLQQSQDTSKFRDGQLQLLAQLQEQAAGNGPSLAQQQFDRNQQQGINSQLALSAGGGSLAARNAANNIGRLNQDLAGQAAQARIQEQLNARAQLGALAGQARGQELQNNQFNAAQNNELMRQRMLQQQRLLQLQLQNAQAQQQGMSGFAQSRGPGLDIQLLNAGGQALAQGNR